MIFKQGDLVILKSIHDIHRIEELKENEQNINWEYVENHCYRKFHVEYASKATVRLEETNSTIWPNTWFEPYAGIDFEIEELFVL